MKENDNPKTRFKAKKGPIMASMIISGGVGGLGYGTTRIVTDSELAESVGFSMGTATAGLMYAALSGTDSQRDAQRCAIQENYKEATIHTLKAGTKFVISAGTTGACIGYEVGGLKGLAIGSALGIASGAKAAFRTKEFHKELGSSYRDILHPARDPKNFPEQRNIREYF